jgi:nucleotide-binding universal stress UspA family protein
VYDGILVPVDGSAASDHAVDHAGRLALAHDAGLHVLHAVEFAQARAARGTTTGVSEQTVEAMAEQGEAVVEAAAARVPDGRPVETTVADGVPSAVIGEHAADPVIDLVVLGTRGRTGLERLALGSTAERVVRTAPGPVLTVHPPAE